MTYKVIATTFSNVTGWTKGPKKSSTVTTTGTLAQAKSAISDISTSLSLNDGESIIITIKAED